MGTMQTPPPPRTLQIQLKCGVSDPNLHSAHNAALSVPSTVGRKALSKILQTLLSLETALPFHFLVDEEPLRTTLEKFLIRRNRSAEQTLNLVYYLPLPEPDREQDKSLSEQWIAALHAAEPGLVLAGGYSASPIVVSEEQMLSEEQSNPHRSAIKAVSWVPGNDSFITASLDQTVRLWKYSSSPQSATPVAEFSSEDAGHPTTFTSVAVKDHTAALGTDNGTIWYIPSTKVPDDNSTATKKRPRIPSLPATRLAELPSSLPITSIAWSDDKLVTAGWEPLARYWDVEKCTSALSVPCGGKAVTGIDLGESLLVSAVDGGVRLVDPRDGKGVVAACGKREAHRGIVAGVRWLGDACVSAGFDGTLRFWDVRSFAAPSRIVQSVHGGGRCLAVDAVKDGERWCVYSVGQDGKIATFTI